MVIMTTSYIQHMDYFGVKSLAVEKYRLHAWVYLQLDIRFKV